MEVVATAPFVESVVDVDCTGVTIGCSPVCSELFRLLVDLCWVWVGVFVLGMGDEVDVGEIAL